MGISWRRIIESGRYKIIKFYLLKLLFWESFSNYIEYKNSKLENMYKELNDKYNNIVSVFNEVIDKVAWWIPIKKFRDKFREKFRVVR